MALDPATHDFEEKSLTVRVGTNNRYGYKLYVNTDNNAKDLVNVADSSKVIENLSSSYSSALFPANYWGYRSTPGTTSSGDYGEFTPGSIVSQSSGPVNENVTTLGFGAKIDFTKPSGKYELDLNFEVVPTVTQEYMQNLDPTTCIDEPTVVIDSRDERAYTIRRLVDGKCWMVENLHFMGESGDPDGAMTLRATTSNVASDMILTYGDLDTGDNTANSYDDAKIHVGTIASGITPIDPSSTAESNIPTVWYNYVAATAGTITGSSNTYESQYDICPKGWRLPDYGEEGVLAASISGSLDTFSPLGGGYYLNGSHAGTWGMYWSSAASDNTKRYRLAYDGVKFDNTTPLERTYGYYIRCVLDEPIGNITTLQQLGGMSSADKTTVKNSMVDSKIYTLRDTRDNQVYSVAKLKDNKIWLVENLNLGATALNGDLTSSNTNLSTLVTKADFEGWKKSSGGETNTDGEYIPITSANSVTSSGIDPVARTPYGTLYNFCAASAGSYCYAIKNGDAQYDICPSGWRIPIGGALGTGNEYEILYNGFDNDYDKMRTSITNGGAGFALSGAFIALPGSQGTVSKYWESSASPSGNQMYVLRIDATTYNPANNNVRTTGYAIRCLLKP